MASTRPTATTPPAAPWYTPGGTLTTLHNFNGRDGQYPGGGLLQATGGNFYGTAGTTISEITPCGKLTTLYTFDSTQGDSTAGLVGATDGNFYGTTLGGVNSYGTIFQITPGGTLTTLHSFSGLDGMTAFGGLFQATDGSFYGTTNQGGANIFGTVFRLSVSLGPFVKTLPTAGQAGSAVKILGTSLTGATSVTFNGTPAVFTVVSPSLITTTVPHGAVTGQVQVTTPGGALTSNVAFRVLRTPVPAGG